MATSVVNPSTETSAIPFVTENVTQARVVYSVPQEQGDPILRGAVVSEEDGEAAAKEGKFEEKGQKYDVVSVDTQTFIKYKVNTLEGAASLMPEEEIINMINSGISVKQGNSIRTQLLGKDKKSGDFDFTFTETANDLRPVLQEITNKRLSPTEKLSRDLTESLGNVPADMLEKFAALIAQRQAELAGGNQ